jgi:hypothetical protein
MAAKRGAARRNDSAAGEAVDRLALVRRILAKCTEALESEGVQKATVGDLIRLLALEKELAGDEKLREIKVQWVESRETERAA